MVSTLQALIYKTQMKFSNSTDNNGIVEQVRLRVGADADDYPIGILTEHINRYYRRAVSKIQEVDAKWQWDDRNATTLPIETVDVVSGQPDYELDDDVREVKRIEILQNSDNASWRRLYRLHEEDVPASIQETFEQDNQPMYYELKGRSVYLYPTPDYSKVAGLKMWNKRTFDEFVTTDTDKEPGIDPLYHDYLVEGAVYEYAKIYKTEIQETAKRDVAEIERDMVRFYRKRGGNSRVMGRQVNAM